MLTTAPMDQDKAALSAIFERAAAAIAMIGPDGRFIFANERFCRLAGRTPDELLALHWSSLADGADAGGAKALLASLMSGEGPAFEMEWRLRRPDGSCDWVHSSMTSIYDSGGAFQFALALSAGITARRHAEEALRQSQKLEAIGQLTGGIAHDFNNLLTPIVGGLDLIQRRLPAGDKTQRLISGAIQSADRARLLVQRLLAFARRQHLDARAVDVRDLVEGLSDPIRRALGPAVEIRVEMDPGLPLAKADPTQLELALINLAVNSGDAMPGGGTLSIAAKPVTVSAEGGQGLSPGLYVCISVSDTGTGMPPEILARAVEPFFSTKAAGKGTGLGLSMVHGLAAQSGGQLTLESELGVGTTATLWLPAAGLERAEGVLTGAQPAAHARPLAILLVDDEELVRAGTAEMLELMGHTVIQLPSASAALEHLASDAACDLVVTDHMMPGMTGAEMAKEARRLRPRLPVILITAYANLREPGADELLRLAKPFHEADLARAVLQAAKGGMVVHA